MNSVLIFEYWLQIIKQIILISDNIKEMSHLSPFTFERLIASVWVHERAVTGKWMSDIRLYDKI